MLISNNNFDTSLFLEKAPKWFVKKWEVFEKDYKMNIGYFDDDAEIKWHNLTDFIYLELDDDEWVKIRPFLRFLFGDGWNKE